VAIFKSTQRHRSTRSLERSIQRSGTSIVGRRFPGPNMSWNILADTRTVLLSPTIASRVSATMRFASDTVIPMIRQRLGLQYSRRSSSSDGSCNTSCRPVSSRSDTMVFWPTETGGFSSPAHVFFCSSLRIQNLKSLNPGANFPSYHRYRSVQVSLL